MLNFDRVAIFIFLICVFFYSASYGSWTWKRNNKLGAVMVYLLSAIALLLPVLAIFFRG